VDGSGGEAHSAAPTPAAQRILERSGSDESRAEEGETDDEDDMAAASVSVRLLPTMTPVPMITPAMAML
jgi:hypothetical protein